MNSMFFLFGAYSVAWLVVAGYLLFNLKKLKNVETRIEDIEELLRRKQ